MVKIDYFRREMLTDPDYQREQAELTALCDGTPNRTWEAVYALRNAGTGHRCLEVGAYPLLFARGLKRQFEHVIATDNYSWAKRPKVAEFNPTPREWEERMGHGIEIREADATALPWPDKWFDCAVAVSVLEHVKDDFLALCELCRVARRVVVTTDISPNAQGFFAFNRVYSPERLETLLRLTSEQEVEKGSVPPEAQWLYAEHTVCGFVVET